MDLCGSCVFSSREVLKEDESGSLKATVEEILFQSKRKRFVCLYCLISTRDTWLIDLIILKTPFRLTSLLCYVNVKMRKLYSWTLCRSIRRQSVSSPKAISRFCALFYPVGSQRATDKCALAWWVSCEPRAYWLHPAPHCCFIWLNMIERPLTPLVNMLSWFCFDGQHRNHLHLVGVIKDTAACNDRCLECGPLGTRISLTLFGIRTLYRGVLWPYSA